MNNQYLRRTIALLLAVVLLSTSCRQINHTAAELVKMEGDTLTEKVTNLIKTEGEKLLATTMSLTKTEGTVDISTKKGRTIPPVDGLKLYSGYDMRTQAVSYAWINLDRVKLVKMDEESEIDIQKKDNDLEVYIRSGSLFFNVTEPLEEDENMNIRTSSMIVGIRGTCGWVSTEEETGAQVHILEGRVSVTAPDTGEEVSVSAGEMAEVRISETGESEITVTDFFASDVPEYILTELEEDEVLAQAILDASGLDVLNPLDESTDENNDNSPALPEQYFAIVSQAASYFRDFAEWSTGQYWYALVQLQTADPVPTLLLKQQSNNYVENIRLFQYEPNSGTMFQTQDTLSEGVADAGGYRGNLYKAGDGNGLLSLEWHSASGEATLDRATLAGNSLQRNTLWEERIDRLPEEYSALFQEIEWYDVGNTDALNEWTAEAPETETTAGETTTAAPLTDGNRIVFTGTINVYTYDQVVALQGSPDPNGPWADTTETFRLIILDSPQMMTLRSADPSSGMIGGTVSMINASGAGGLDQYNGQHHTFSVDPNTTRFPSDTSLPLGQPYTNDVHVLD